MQSAMTKLQTFSWSETFETGIPAIDIQHKEMVRAFNDLAEAIETGRSAATIKKLLVYLQFYAEWHFERETLYGEMCCTPLEEASQQAHIHFHNIFSRLRDEYRASDASESVARRMHTELTDWVIDHVLKVDAVVGNGSRKLNGGFQTG